MPATLKAPNFEPINILVVTQLGVTTNPGDTTATLVSTEGITTNDIVYFGTAPDETTERSVVSSFAGNVLTLASALNFTHVANGAVYQVSGDQLQFYRATAPSDGSVPDDSLFAPVSSGLVTLNPYDLETTFTDPTGGVNYWYKFTHYNSITQAETDISACIPARGGDFGHYVSIGDVRTEAGFNNNEYVTDSDIDAYRRRAEAEAEGWIAMAYILPFKTPPMLVEYAVLKLAAGYLMCQKYGPWADGESHEGLGKISEARALLKRISERTTVLVDGMDNIITYSQKIGGYPNSNAPRDQGYSFSTDKIY